MTDTSSATKILQAKTTLLDQSAQGGKWLDVTMPGETVREIFDALDSADAEARYWRDQAAQMAAVLIADGCQDVHKKSASKSTISRRLSIARAIKCSLSGNGWIGHTTSFAHAKDRADAHLAEIEKRPA